MCFDSSRPTTGPQPQAPAQPPRFVNSVDCRDWENYGFDSGGPDSRLSSDDSALAALTKGLQEITANEMETLLNDRPVPEPGVKDVISVKEAVDASLCAV